MKFKCITGALTVTLFVVTNATDIFRKLDNHDVEKSIKKSKSTKGMGKGKTEGGPEDSEMYHMMDSMSLALSFSMASESGKGGKKGGRSSKAGKSSKASKSEKKSSKKGSDSVQGGDDETPAISPSSSGDARPPSTAPPPSTLPPPIDGLQAVEIPRYGVFYSLSQSLMPMREDYLEVEAITNEYFNAYMLDIFEEPGVESLMQFRTTLHTSEFVFDQPILIYYDSVAYFAEDLPSDSLPSAQTLETLLQLSLEDPSDYLDLLAQLGVENAFASTTAVEFADFVSSVTNSTDDATNEEPSATSSERSESTGASLFAIAAGAIGAGLLVTGALFYRRRRNSCTDNVSFTKRSKPGHGGATIAGETFTGESYDGNTSRVSHNGASLDEERGEPTQSSDISSVSPAWEGQDGYGDGDYLVSDSSVVKATRGKLDDERTSGVFDEDGSTSDDIMSVGTEDLALENAFTEKHQLSVAEIEAMLYSQF